MNSPLWAQEGVCVEGGRCHLGTAPCAPSLSAAGADKVSRKRKTHPGLTGGRELED